MFSLCEKNCVITGGSGDLGRAIADAFLQFGARVILVGRNEERLKSVLRSRTGITENLFIHPIDVSKSDQVELMADQLIQQHGYIDVLVTAAGIQYRCPVMEMPTTAWNRVLQTNLNGTFYCAKSFGRHMMTRKSGRIIMITSLTAEIGIPNIAAYAASRGAIKQLCMTMAVELAPSGVTVNCIGPGRIATVMTQDIHQDVQRYESTLRVIPMGRWGMPQDVGSCAVFLASDASNYITGQSFYIDGGWLAGGGNLTG